MFAQLEPAAQADEIVDADVVEAHSRPSNAAFDSADSVASADSALDEEPTAALPFSSAAAPVGQAGQAEQAGQADEAWPEALADAFEWPSQPGAGASATPRGGYGGPDLTLEALEDVHAADGYQPFTLEPGALAALTDDDPRGAPPASETARALDDFFQGPEVPPNPQPEPLAEPEPTPEPAAGPSDVSPTDYPARLAAARAQRDAGALDDALVEYRALLRNAPDLLPDVLDDLQAALDEQPEHPELHRLVSDARIRQGDYLSALESLNRSVSLTQPTDE